MTQHRPRSHRKDGGHQVTAVGQDAVADRVDAAVQSDQVAGGDALLDVAGAQPERQQLPASHNSVLSLGQRPNDPEFPPDIVGFSGQSARHAAIAPSVPGNP